MPNTKLGIFIKILLVLAFAAAGWLAADFVSAASPTVEQVETVDKVCKKFWFEGNHCQTDLLAIAKIETHFNCKAVGKLGETGCFQIMPFHKVNGTDFRIAAEWTLRYLIKNGYPKYRTWAIQCHNGCGIKNNYFNKVNAAAIGLK